MNDSGIVNPLLVAAAALLVAAPVVAHHSVAANFDRQKTVELTGTVSAVHLRNPHSQYVLDVIADDGEVTEWFIEWSDRNALVRRKVDLDLIRVGDVITVTAWPSRRLENVGFFVQAILPDGSMYRDCGFEEFRRAVADSSEYSCEAARGR
jgi:hypothetical protein